MLDPTSGDAHRGRELSSYRSPLFDDSSLGAVALLAAGCAGVIVAGVLASIHLWLAVAGICVVAVGWAAIRWWVGRLRLTVFEAGVEVENPFSSEWVAWSDLSAVEARGTLTLVLHSGRRVAVHAVFGGIATLNPQVTAHLEHVASELTGYWRVHG